MGTSNFHLLVLYALISNESLLTVNHCKKKLSLKLSESRSNLCFEYVCLGGSLTPCALRNRTVVSGPLLF